MENIAIYMKMDVEYILSLLKLFAMFQIKFNNNLDEKIFDITMRCNKCKKEICLSKESSMLKETITPFVID